MDQGYKLSSTGPASIWLCRSPGLSCSAEAQAAGWGRDWTDDRAIRRALDRPFNPAGQSRLWRRSQRRRMDGLGTLTVHKLHRRRGNTGGRSWWGVAFV